ncbi:MAG: hypothetical protein WBY94_26705 [Polyangiaceae bacterium]
MGRTFVSAVLFASLCMTTESAPAESLVPPGASSAAPEVQWALHVLYLPGSQDARSTLPAKEGVIAVRPPWQCSYKRTTMDRQDLVKIKCIHEDGAVVGTVAMCSREFGQSDLAQLSIGVDGVPSYETIDLSCSVPRDRPRADLSYGERN